MWWWVIGYFVIGCVVGSVILVRKPYGDAEACDAFTLGLLWPVPVGFWLSHLVIWAFLAPGFIWLWWRKRVIAIERKEEK